ncbi:MAG: hypothetical protein ACYDCO_25500 [Armatimonadota bacterium]
MTEPITEEWLRAAGFKWHEVERSPCKHWVLWIGWAQPRRMLQSAEDLGVELTKHTPESEEWMLFVRADYSGRYSRFLFMRDVTAIGQLTRFIECLTDTPFDPANALYGALRTPEQAARLRAEADWLDVRIAVQREEFDERLRAAAFNEKHGEKL